MIWVKKVTKIRRISSGFFAWGTSPKNLATSKFSCCKDSFAWMEQKETKETSFMKERNRQRQKKREKGNLKQRFEF